MTSIGEGRPGEDPPTYEASTSQNPTIRNANRELPHFVLDGTLIFPGPPPSRAAYELNSPPCEAKSAFYELRKIAYKLPAHGEGVVRSRVDPIYSIRIFRMPNARRHVLVNGLRRGCTKEALMVPSWDGPVGWVVKGLLKSEQRWTDVFRRRGPICWFDRDGRLVAEETRVERRQDGKVEGLPSLEVKAQLDEGWLDVVVACWVGRLWRESEKEGAEGGWLDHPRRGKDSGESLKVYW